MADVHPDVRQLLSALLGSPLARLADDALDGIIEEEPVRPDRFLDVQVRPLGAAERRDQGYRQLDLASSVIVGRLKRERAMCERLRDLASDLELKSISVLPPNAESGEPTPGRPDELLSAERLNALNGFEDAWLKVVGQLRSRWGQFNGD